VSLLAVTRVLGLLILATGSAMVVPLLVSLGYGETHWRWFAICLLASCGVGALVAWLCRGSAELRNRDGFLIVTLGWLCVGFVGAMPFWFSGQIPSFTDAMFESVSGFTTTGASILDNVEVLGRGPALWRCLIQWLGGMGIVVLSVAILPILGVGGMQLFQAEAPGPSPDRLTPRIKETARLLWGVYCMISAAEFLALLLCGLDWFDALCHTFATMATGGFSPRAASIGAYQSPAVEYVVIFFMFAAGANFSLHYAAIRGRVRSYFHDSEFKVYLTVVLFATTVIILTNVREATLGTEENVRASLFQVVSIVTTTGFGTADYELWAPAAVFVLLMLMFIGGCAGSTGGGMKNVRLLLVTRHGLNELRKMIHPRAVYPIRFNHRAVSPEILTNILGFVLLLMIATVVATFAMTLLGVDLLTAFGSVAATINNIGPGIGEVGPTDHFGHLPALGKWVLVFCMLLGRLELFTVLVLLTPDFWRRT
jgi:trk system potassium uptake protein TrkH